jgi:predicted PurR-regulated permease PerM
MATTPAAARAHADRADAAAPTVRGLIVFGVVVAFAVACLLWALYLARQALLLIYVSALLATGLGPLVRMLERRGIVRGAQPLPRWAAVTVVYLVSGVVGLAVVLTIVPTLIGQMQDLARRAPELLHQGQQWLIGHGVLGRELSVGEVVRQPGATDAVGAVLGTVWTVLGGIVGVVTILVLSFYFLLETDSLFAAFIRLMPRRQRLHVRAIAHQITSKVSAWLSGQVLVAGIIGATAAVALGLMGVPYFYVLAIVAAVGELIPLLGPILAAIPAIGLASTVSWQLAIATAVFFVVQQQVENHVIVPRVMANQVGLSPVAVIVAFLIGASLFGIAGAILAIPTAAIIQVLFYELAPATEE